MSTLWFFVDNFERDVATMLNTHAHEKPCKASIVIQTLLHLAAPAWITGRVRPMGRILRGQSRDPRRTLTTPSQTQTSFSWTCFFLCLSNSHVAGSDWQLCNLHESRGLDPGVCGGHRVRASNQLCSPKPLRLGPLVSALLLWSSWLIQGFVIDKKVWQFTSC